MKKIICAILVVFSLAACGKRVDITVERPRIYITEHRTESGKLCVVADGVRGIAMSCIKE